MADMDSNEPSEFKSFGKEVGKGLLKEAKMEAKITMKWGLGGALVGAVVLGGVGWFKFGTTIGLIGAGAGALLGGAFAVWFYLSATTLSD
jgi:hypothetical protein